MVPSSIAVCASNGSTDMINSTITEGDGDTGAKNANTVWCEKRPRAEHDWYWYLSLPTAAPGALPLAALSLPTAAPRALPSAALRRPSAAPRALPLAFPADGGSTGSAWGVGRGDAKDASEAESGDCWACWAEQSGK